jgi:hypothetical protein
MYGRFHSRPTEFQTAGPDRLRSGLRSFRRSPQRASAVSSRPRSHEADLRSKPARAGHPEETPARGLTQKENCLARSRNPLPSAKSRFPRMVRALQWGVWTLKGEVISGSSTSKETPFRDSRLVRGPCLPIPCGLRTAVASSFDRPVWVCTTFMKSRLLALMMKRFC